MDASKQKEKKNNILLGSDISGALETFWRWMNFASCLYLCRELTAIREEKIFVSLLFYDNWFYSFSFWRVYFMFVFLSNGKKCKGLPK